MRELDLAGHDADPGLALDAQLVVLAGHGRRGEVHVGTAACVGPERTGAHLLAVVADAPELVDRTGTPAQTAHPRFTRVPSSRTFKCAGAVAPGAAGGAAQPALERSLAWQPTGQTVNAG